MAEDKKKIAAVTAVLYCLQAEEEEARQRVVAGRLSPAASEGFWSYSGRQAQMMLRSMAQMRLLPGWRG